MSYDRPDWAAMYVQQFKKAGFVVARSVVEYNVITSLRDFLASAAAMNLARLDELARRYSGSPPSSETLALPRFSEEQITRMTREDRDIISGNFTQAVKADSRLWEVLRSPRLATLLRALLSSSKLYLHMYPSPRYVAPGNDLAAVPLHTDRQYNGHLSSFITVWVPIEVSYPEMGGVIVYPQSHLVASNETQSSVKGGLWFAPLGEPVEEGILALANEGDVLILHESLLHKSAPNRSSHLRLSADFRVFGDHASTSKHYLDCQSWTVVAPGKGDRHDIRV